MRQSKIDHIYFEFLNLLKGTNIDYRMVKGKHVDIRNIKDIKDSAKFIVTEETAYMHFKEFANKRPINHEYISIIFNEENWNKFTLCIQDLVNSSIKKDYFKFHEKEQKAFFKKYGIATFSVLMDDWADYPEECNIEELKAEILNKFYKTPGWYIWHNTINFEGQYDFMISYFDGEMCKDLTKVTQFKSLKGISLSNIAVHPHHDFGMEELIPQQYCSYIGSKLEYKMLRRFINWSMNPMEVKE